MSIILIIYSHFLRLVAYFKKNNWFFVLEMSLDLNSNTQILFEDEKKIRTMKLIIIPVFLFCSIQYIFKSFQLK